MFSISYLFTSSGQAYPGQTYSGNASQFSGNHGYAYSAPAPPQPTYPDRSMPPKEPDTSMTKVALKHCLKETLMQVWDPSDWIEILYIRSRIHLDLSNS